MNETFEWLFASFALFLVLEGLIPFASPETWKKLMTNMLSIDNFSLRITGFVLMVCGSIGLWLIHN